MVSTCMRPPARSRKHPHRTAPAPFTHDCQVVPASRPTCPPSPCRRSTGRQTWPATTWRRSSILRLAGCAPPASSSLFSGAPNLALSPLCACLYSCRVAFRAYQVLTQPVEKLVQVLGLEVPIAPLVSLAGIKADGVLLHWKAADQRASDLKYVLRINGIDSAWFEQGT
jgi:hypothetical protein